MGMDVGVFARTCLQLHLSDSSADADEESPKLEAAVLLLEELVSHFGRTLASLAAFGLF